MSRFDYPSIPSLSEGMGYELICIVGAAMGVEEEQINEYARRHNFVHYGLRGDPLSPPYVQKTELLLQEIGEHQKAQRNVAFTSTRKLDYWGHALPSAIRLTKLLNVAQYVNFAYSDEADPSISKIVQNVFKDTPIDQEKISSDVQEAARPTRYNYVDDASEAISTLFMGEFKNPATEKGEKAKQEAQKDIRRYGLDDLDKKGISEVFKAMERFPEVRRELSRDHNTLPALLVELNKDKLSVEDITEIGKQLLEIKISALSSQELVKPRKKKLSDDEALSPELAKEKALQSESMKQIAEILKKKIEQEKVTAQDTGETPTTPDKMTEALNFIKEVNPEEKEKAAAGGDRPSGVCSRIRGAVSRLCGGKKAVAVGE